MRSLMDKYQGRKNNLISILILSLALVQGVVYIFIMPPWQHYDEPGHFEYAWLAANLDHWPKKGEYDAEIRREVAASMIEANFFRGMSSIPNLLATDPPVNIGYSQLGDVPLYYFLASLPLRIFRYTDVTFQLYSARFVSLILFLVTIWVSIGICREIFGMNHPLSWMVPLFLVLLPPFTDLMTSVNNDVAAITFSVLFLWGSIRIILRGLNFRRVIWVIAALGACTLSKSTAIIAIPLFIIVICIGVSKLKQSRIFIYLVPLLGILLFTLMFSWKRSAPALYYATKETLIPTRLKSDISPVGEYIFALYSQKLSVDAFYQMLPQNKISQLAGKTVTLGVWMWADLPVDVQLPELIINHELINIQEYVHLETVPQFYAYSFQFPEIGSLGWLTVYPSISQERFQTYWDGWVLAEGEYSASTPPIFQDEQVSKGIWDGKPFVNIIRNASGEILWPILISPINKYLSTYFGITSSYLWANLDIQGTSWYYQKALTRIFETFWVKFGWAHVSLLGKNFYWIFSLLSFTGLLGSVLAGWYYRKRLPWSLILFLALDLLGTFWITIFRGVGTWFNNLLLPAARYAYPAIIPIAITLCGGLFFLYDRYIHRIWIPMSVFIVCFLVGMITYDILSILSIVIYYGI